MLNQLFPAGRSGQSLDEVVRAFVKRDGSSRAAAAFLGLPAFAAVR